MQRCVLLWLILLSALPGMVRAQREAPPPFQIYGSFAYTSNAFNGLPGSRRGLAGWDAGVAFPAWHNLRPRLDLAHFEGTNLGAPQHALSIMGGGQYDRAWHRERIFAEALFGDVSLNRNWGPGGHAGNTASFTEVLGGGLDTPLNRHFSLRVEGTYRHTNLALIHGKPDPSPYHLSGLPNNFFGLTTGIVWAPPPGSAHRISAQSRKHEERRVESELVIEDLNSFGHFHIFASTWWSYLHVAGVEYDRHSWGNFAGARLDYVAEVLPVVLLRQPSKTDSWGDPLSQGHITLPGVGVSPIGLRMMWRDGKSWEPYYQIKAGMIAFTQKALSSYASYQDFSLQQSIGVQFRLSQRWELRAGATDFHFSNGFMVPSNPGIDEMMYGGGLCYRLGQRRSPL